MKLFVFVALLCVVPALANSGLRFKRGLFSHLAKSTSSLLTKAADTVTEAVEDTVSTVTNVTASVTATIASSADDAVSTVVNTTSALTEAVVATTEDAVTDAVDTVANVTSTIAETAEAATTLVSNFTSTVEADITTALSNASASIFGSSCSTTVMTSSILTILKSIWSTFACIIPTAFTQIVALWVKLTEIISILYATVSELFVCYETSTIISFPVCLAKTVFFFDTEVLLYLSEIPSELVTFFTTVGSETSVCVASSLMTSAVTSAISATTAAGCTLSSLL